MINLITMGFLIIGLIILLILQNKENKKLREENDFTNKMEMVLKDQRNAKQNKVDDNILIETYGNKEKIILIDDDLDILEMVTMLLTKCKYKVVPFSKGKDSIDYFKKNYKIVDLIIVDFGLKDINGKSIIKTFKKIRKDIPIIIFSGYSYIKFDSEKDKKMVDKYIHKPASVDTILDSIVDVLTRYNK